MKKTVALTLLLAGVSPAYGQERERAPTFQRASSVLGSNVMVQRETIGRVSDLVINDSGGVDYLIVKRGEDYVAVPWGAVRRDERGNALTINSRLDRSQLDALAFTGDRWPSFSDRTWMTNMRKVWTTASTREPARKEGTGDVHSGTTPVRDPKAASDLRPGTPGKTNPVGPGVDDTKAIDNGVESSPRTPGKVIPRRPGVDDTKNIDNGVESGPRTPTRPRVVPENGPTPREATPRPTTPPTRVPALPID